MVEVFIVIIVAGAQSRHKEAHLASVFNASISWPPAPAPAPSASPPSVGISVGGVSLDLCPLMLTAADLWRLTTKRAGDKLSPPAAEEERAVRDGSTLGSLPSGRAGPPAPFSTWPTHTCTHLH